MNMRLGRVAAIHPEDHSADIVMVDDGSRLSGVQIMASSASSNTGTSDLPTPAAPKSGDQWDLRESTDRDLIAVISFVGRTPIVMGFLYPQVCQMTFSDPQRRVVRHASDVYSTIDGAGNAEFYHPSGTYFRIGTSPDHEDLSGKDVDGGWAIKNNTGAAPHVRLTVANGGAVKATLDIDPDGNIVLTHLGNLTSTTGGNAVVNVTGTTDVTSGGNASLTAPKVTLVTAETECTGHLTVKGGMSVSGGGGATVTGNMTITGGDVKADTISLKGHVHSGIQPGGGNTATPVP